MIALRVDSVAPCAAAWQRERYGTSADRQRARSIVSPLRRAQFEGGRWLAAQLLAQYAGGDAGQWRVRPDRHGAPRASRLAAEVAPHLSIAHRADVVAVAIADAPVGVDVEVARALHSDPDDRSDWILCAQERACYHALETNERAAALLVWWTLKEAWSKRDGRGLALGAMRELLARPVSAGGNALVWVDDALTVALCCDALAEGEPVAAQGLAAAPRRWQVGRVNHPR